MNANQQASERRRASQLVRHLAKSDRALAHKEPMGPVTQAAMARALVGFGQHPAQLDGCRIYLRQPVQELLAAVGGAEWIVCFSSVHCLHAQPLDLWPDYLAALERACTRPEQRALLAQTIIPSAQRIPAQNGRRWTLNAELMRLLKFGTECLFQPGRCWLEVWDAGVARRLEAERLQLAMAAGLPQLSRSFPGVAEVTRAGLAVPHLAGGSRGSEEADCANVNPR